MAFVDDDWAGAPAAERPLAFDAPTTPVPPSHGAVGKLPNEVGGEGMKTWSSCSSCSSSSSSSCSTLGLFFGETQVPSRLARFVCAALAAADSRFLSLRVQRRFSDLAHIEKRRKHAQSDVTGVTAVKAEGERFDRDFEVKLHRRRRAVMRVALLPVAETRESE